VAVVFIFRNPERELPRGEKNSVLSPVDGVVKTIEEIEDSEYAYKITILSRYSDISILRVPISSTVSDIKKINGTRLPSKNRLSKKLNENATIVFEDDNSNRVKLTHMLTNSFANLKIDPIKSKNLLQSTRYGAMVKGETIIYLPQNFRLNISVTNEVKASQTLIGYFS
jgi:phosphatidylserine decarboxylase